jgi:hypothetical protein
MLAGTVVILLTGHYPLLASRLRGGPLPNTAILVPDGISFGVQASKNETYWQIRRARNLSPS